MGVPRKQAYWDEYFIEMAEFVSTKSKDPSTKYGAVIVRPDHTVAATGYNGFPRGMLDNKEFYENRTIKYQRTIHCEMNAVLTAREPVAGYTLYIWQGISCDRCAPHMIQAGITRVVYPKLETGYSKRWAEEIKTSIANFKEAGVEVVEHK